ncbi:MAG TPA: methyltransferase domain-containing protein [Candidatus Krumholzibacteria bacterium]|nr:methyltransferase domain-containing protein [Candidatus Krumholzibacteria bacterium]HPD73257.1 methyltransferase domain-containing protein [Candidatus Krumholzibacteria bacterium]HRY40219.1 methyltransferase domain-containing protein [Candidatus Krumholzibacteria bacterium]
MNSNILANPATRDSSPAHTNAVHQLSPRSGGHGPDLAAIKARQQATWSAGDYGQIGVRLQIVGESLCEAVDLDATDAVLDVAAGNGNASLAAARRFAEVVSTDYVPALLEQARRRAEADRLPISFREADAEALPFVDRSFDVVLSTFGVMFAPDQERVASELLRVTRPGGRIGLANWTPDGFIGKLFEVVSAFVAPPPGLRSPLEWGTEPRLVELFGPHAADLRTRRQTYTFRYRSARHWIETFRAYYGPVHKAFAALDENGQQALHAALLAFLDRWNRGGGALRIPGEYLEVVVVR